MLGAGRIETYTNDNGNWGVWSNYGDPYRMGLWNGSTQLWPRGTFSNAAVLGETLMHEALHEIDPDMSEADTEWWTDFCVEW